MKWVVCLQFGHLGNWKKFVVVEEKTKHKAMIAAEKAYPQGKANEVLTVKVKEGKT